MYPGWFTRHTKTPIVKTPRGYTGLAGKYTGMGPVRGRLLKMGMVRNAPRTSRLYGDKGGLEL